MGYTTDFTGEFTLDKPLTPKQSAYLNKFRQTRRIQRDALKVSELPDPLRLAVGLPVGEEGGFFVGAGGDYGQDHGHPSILDYNRAPSGQPGLWCKWEVADEGLTIRWDGGEKFYNYVEWLKYIVDNFLAPWGYKLNGEVEWVGDDRSDIGLLVVTDNVVTTKAGKITYEE
jgi:hypothetical protein